MALLRKWMGLGTRYTRFRKAFKYSSQCSRVWYREVGMGLDKTRVWDTDRVEITGINNSSKKLKSNQRSTEKRRKLSSI